MTEIIRRTVIVDQHDRDGRHGERENARHDLHDTHRVSLLAQCPTPCRQAPTRSSLAGAVTRQ